MAGRYGLAGHRRADWGLTYRIAVIAGDGIGTEVVPEGLRVLDAAAASFDFELAYEHFDFASADYYVRHGAMLPPDWLGF